MWGIWRVFSCYLFPLWPPSSSLRTQEQLNLQNLREQALPPPLNRFRQINLETVSYAPNIKVFRKRQCPTGTYMRGFGEGSNTFLCSLDPRKREISQLDFDGLNSRPSQAHGMHLCPSSQGAIRVMTAAGVGSNVWQCGSVARR